MENSLLTALEKIHRQTSNAILTGLGKLSTNTFEGHAGRPGQRGGSLPKGEGGTPAVKEKEKPSSGSKEILEMLRANPGGFSYRPGKGAPQGGYMSSMKDGPIFSPDISDEEALKTIDGFLNENSELLKGDNMYVGGWLNNADGKFYLDASGNFQDLNQAMTSAASTHQIAIFDMNTFTEIRTGEWLDANPKFEAPPGSREWYKSNP